MSRDGAGGDIISEKGLRYKRNVLAICFISAVLLYSGSSLKDATLFGVRLPEGNDDVNREVVAWAVVMLLLVYQWVNLVYYGVTDYISWRQSVKTNLKLLPKEIFFTLRKGDLVSARDGLKKVKITRVEIKPGKVMYDFATYLEGGNIVTETLFNSSRQLVRRSLIMFFTLDFGGPVLFGIAVAYFIEWHLI